MAGVNQSTSGGTNETTEGQNALDMSAAEINKFAGEVYEDGKPVSKQTPSTGKEAAAKPQTPSQKAAAAAAANAGSDDGDEGADEGEHKPDRAKDKTIQQRINIAVGKQRQAERDRDAANANYKALEARLAALEKGGQTPAQKAQTAKDPNAEPDPSDFEYGEADVKFIRAMARWEVKQELQGQKEEGTKQQQAASATAAEKAAQASLDKFWAAGTEKFGDDFQEKVGSEKIHITPILARLLLDSDHGIDIAFDITADADLAKRVSAMSPERQAAWFGSYEDQHYSSDTADAEEEEEEEVAKPDPKPASKPVSRAPKPPEHKNRGGGSSEAARADTSDFAAFERMAMKQR